MKISVNAYSKINIFLDITDTLKNGYHKLENITQSVTLCDGVTVEIIESEKTSVTITCDNPEIPTDEKNTAFKAAVLFLREVNKTAAIHIDIEKRIPIMGGMGGSSVDAAGVLYAMNELYDKPLSMNRLCEIGKQLGADVPICLLGGTLYTSGEDAKMKQILCNPSYYIVCVQPDFKCSTKEAYSLYDSSPSVPNNKLQHFISALKNGNATSFCDYMYNVFTVLYNDDRIKSIKEMLCNLGAKKAELTGSGSVIFGIFSDEKTALSAIKKLESAENYNVFLTKPCSCGVSKKV